MTNDSFWVSHSISPVGCNYHYLVVSGAFSHTAFATRKGLNRWMEERGLTLEKPLSDTEDEYCRILGSYRTADHLRDEQQFPQAEIFSSLEGIHTRTLSNGDYVEAIITLDPDGVRTVHTLNPNVKNRYVFDYFSSNRMIS